MFFRIQKIVPRCSYCPRMLREYGFVNAFDKRADFKDLDSLRSEIREYYAGLRRHVDCIMFGYLNLDLYANL